MMQDEFLLLIRDQVPIIERELEHQAPTNSLTAKILLGWFGTASRRALIVRRAREKALRLIIG